MYDLLAAADPMLMRIKCLWLALLVHFGDTEVLRDVLRDVQHDNWANSSSMVF